MAPAEKPIGLALMICEKIITEEVTKNKTLVGTFNQITALNFPAQHPSFCVFVALTNGNGESDVRLSLTRPDGVQVFKIDGHLKFDGPTQVLELAFVLHNLTFVEPGEYALEFRANDELVLDRTMSVAQAR